MGNPNESNKTPETHGWKVAQERSLVKMGPQGWEKRWNRPSIDQNIASQLGQALDQARTANQMDSDLVPNPNQDRQLEQSPNRVTDAPVEKVVVDLKDTGLPELPRITW